MRPWNMSYWGVVGLTGARQLLVTSPPTLEPISLGRHRHHLTSHKGRKRQDEPKVRFSIPTEEFIIQPEYKQDEIDEDDYVLSTVDNEIPEESSSSESSDTESNSADSITLTDTSPSPEEHTTQSKEENQCNEAESSVVINLPTATHYSQRSPPLSNTGPGAIDGLDIHSISSEEEDDDTPDTTILRLPGMRSRLEITRITWVREIPISPPKPLYETAPQSNDINRHHFAAAQQFNHHRSRAFSDPSSFSSSMPTSIPYQDDFSIPATMISTPHESYNDTSVGVAHGRISHGHSLSLAAFNSPTFGHTYLRHQAVPSPYNDLYANIDCVTTPTHALMAHSQPTSPIHSALSLHSPTHVLAGPSQTLLDILNGSSANAHLHSIPAPLLLAGSGLCPAQDPPVFKPKPIGSTNTSHPIGRRRLSDSASDVLYSVPAAASDEGEEAPPWPPVLAPLSC